MPCTHGMWTHPDTCKLLRRASAPRAQGTGYRVQASAPRASFWSKQGGGQEPRTDAVVGASRVVRDWPEQLDGLVLHTCHTMSTWDSGLVSTRIT